MTRFADLTKPLPAADGWQMEFAPETAIWGVNGGYLAAAALRVAGVSTDKARPVSLTGHFLRGVRPGTVSIRCRSLSETVSTEMVEVDIVQAEKLCCRFHIWATIVREGPRQKLTRMPLAPHPEELKTLEEIMELDEKPPAPFWNVFDQRPVNRIGSKNRPHREPRIFRWYRYRDRSADIDSFLGAAESLPIIDTMGLAAAWEPQDLPFLNALSPTLSLSVSFYEPAGENGWMLCDARCTQASDGLISTAVDIWSEDGRLLAQGLSQMFVKSSGGDGEYVRKAKD